MNPVDVNFIKATVLFFSEVASVFKVRAPTRFRCVSGVPTDDSHSGAGPSAFEFAERVMLQGFSMSPSVYAHTWKGAWTRCSVWFPVLQPGVTGQPGAVRPA